MRKFTAVLTLGWVGLTLHMAFGQSIATGATGSNTRTRMIEDFEDKAVIERIGTTAGVTVSLTEKDAVSGKYALEVRVAPYSKHKNEWPYIYFVSPKFCNPPLDLTRYSKLSMSIRNVTDGLANIYVQASTLPYNDGGRNFAGESFVIPGGTSWACGLPSANLTYGGEKEADGQRIIWNDPSNVRLIQIVFPANEIDAVYHIDAIQAVYDPAVGSPGEKLAAAVETISRQFGLLGKTIKRMKLGENERQAVEERYAQLGRTIGGLSQAYTEGSKKGFQGHYTALKRDADRAARQFGELLLADKKEYFAWEIDPYLNILKDEAPGFQNAELKNIDVCMAQNEFRDKVFMVSAPATNVRLEVQCQAQGKLPPGAVQVQETLYFTNTVGELVGDAVYALTGPLAIPARESRQIRLRFDSRQTAIQPGRYAFNIRLCDLNSGIEKTIPVRLEVWGFRLPSYDVLANNSYAEFDNCEFAPEELTAKAVAHMKMYGLNMVFIHPAEMPRTKVDAEGNLLGFDSTAFEKRIRAVQKGWQSAPGEERLKFLLGALVINTFRLDRPDIEYTGKAPTPKWKAIFPRWYAYLKETTRRLGIADEDLIMVLHDEPNEACMVNGVIPLAQAIKDVDPQAIITSNTSNPIGDPVKSQQFYKLIDIFQPHLPGLKDSPYLLDWVRKSGKTLWSYKCLGGFNRKNANPYEYYRVYGWDLVKYGLTGMGVWTYCAQGQGPWKSPDGGAILIVKHPARDEVAHTRRYEMFREGADDYRYIWKLREVAKKKGTRAQKDAEKLIQEAVADVISNVSDTSRCEKWRLRIAREIMKLQ